jgi:hypothetical protein
MERLKEIFTYFLAAMAMLSLLCAVYEAMNQRIASSGLLAGIFIVAGLFVYLPQLEAFKAFGVEARLIHQEVDRAKEILEKIRQVSIASAKSSYLSFAYAGRLGGIPEQDKQKVLDSVHEQLRNIGVTTDEFKEIVFPHVSLIGYDLYYYFYATASGVLKHNNSARDVIENWEGIWVPRGIGESLKSALFEGRSFTAYLEQLIPRTGISAQETEKLRRLAARIGDLYQSCIERGGYSDDTVTFVQLFRNNASNGPDSYYALLMADPPAWQKR